MSFIRLLRTTPRHHVHIQPRLFPLQALYLLALVLKLDLLLVAVPDRVLILHQGVPQQVLQGKSLEPKEMMKTELNN